ncbi:MAG TPA: diacylglycerol kinase family protein [Candidatus Thermoplasmatota archaeon]|nr:diacylglycerol kinase family protein [Candidatus Thermoplasmatota archaeon]
MRIAVVANRASGPGALAAAQERVAQIESAFAGIPAELDVRCVDGRDLAARAREALRDGADVVAAAGGDGTVNQVAGVLAGSQTPLAVLPLGTLNHFARDLGLPADLGKAAAIAAGGVPTQVDAAEVNGHLFVNNSSIGVYPRAVRERERRRKPGGSKELSMLGAAWTVLRRLPSHHVVLSVDGQPVRRTTPFVFVGNNVYETRLARLGTRASLTQGRLCVYHARHASRTSMLALAARTLVDRLDSARDLEMHEALRLTIHSPRTSMRVALDGEVLSLETPLEYRIRPRHLRVMAPRPTGSPAAPASASAARPEPRGGAA